MLTNQLTHPSYRKNKIYHVILGKPLTPHDKTAIEKGILLDDGVSHLGLTGKGKTWTVTMHEGRNRQIRRTFSAIGNVVTSLHRTHFGPYTLGTLSSAKYTAV